MHLYLDIETIPAQCPEVLAEIRAAKESQLENEIASVKAPGNYGQEAADKWMLEKGAAQIKGLQSAFESEVDAAYRKTGLDGAFGQICVIGYAFDNDEVQYIFHPTDEKFVLKSFDTVLRTLPQTDAFNTTVIGHNVANFDMRFLTQRHIINGIRPHVVLARAAQAKPWEADKVFDTMVQWAGIGNKISLDKLCKALSIQSPKGDIDGSKVWDYVKDGRIEEVAEYCKRDVDATRSAHLRMTFA